MSDERSHTIRSSKELAPFLRLGQRLASAHAPATLTIVFEGDEEQRVCLRYVRPERVPIHESAIRAILDMAGECGFDAELNADATYWEFWPRDQTEPKS